MTLDTVTPASADVDLNPNDTVLFVVVCTWLGMVLIP
jgi:hypothetical protein